MNLPEFSINRRVTITMITLIVVLFGIVSFFTLGLDLMPDIEKPVLTVMTNYEGVAAEDVEQLVTKPIEEVISNVKGIKSVNSISAEGRSSVVAEFEWGSDLDAKGQDIRDMIERIKKYLPEDAENPLVIKMNISQMPVIMYGVTGMKNANELGKYLDDDVVPRIERIDGVAQVMSVGGLAREIDVFLDRSKLELYKIGTAQVMGALSQGNQNVSGGYVNSGHKEYLVRTVGVFKNINIIENTVITNYKGAAVRIRDVGRVQDTYEESRHYLRVNGKDAVMFAIMKQSGANTVNVVKKAQKTLSELAPSFPSGIEFHPIFDQSEIIERSTSSTIKEVIIGGFLAVLLIMLFLRDWRPTFAIAMAIPLSILTAFIGLKLLGYTFNIMTLGALALVVGRLVDDAVVVIENTFRHLHAGDNRKEAAKKGASEVGLAIGSSTLVTIAVFLPMALSGGLAGQLTRPLAATISLGLLASLFVAMTIVPMIASLLFKKKSAEVFEKDEKQFNKIRKAYEAGLKWSLSHRKTILTVAGVAFALSVVAIPRLGAEFMPASDSGMALLKIKMPVGTNLEETHRMVSTIEKRIESMEEKQFILASVGPSSSKMSSGSSLSASDVNEAMLMIRLKDRKDRKRSSDAIIADLRKSFPILRDASFEFVEISGMSASSSPIELKFFGKDLDILKTKADEAMALIKDVPGLKDINISMQEGKPEFRILPDRDKAATMGLSVGDIGNAVRYSNFGQVVTRYRDQGDEIDVRMRLDKDNRSGTEDMRLIPIVSRTGTVTPVANIADIKYDKGPVQITRENRTRKITITANIQGRDVNSITTDIKAKFKNLQLAPGYFIEYGGTYKNMSETVRDLSIALIISILLVYMIMAALFESFSQPFVIMFAIPLGLIGVVAGLGAFGLTISAPSLMGFIILVGIVVTNGIVMIDYVNKLRAQGLEKHEALVQGASVRLRPIIITALATIMGVIPMIFARSQGSEMMLPLAVTVGCGLLVSTFMTLFIVPVVYSIVDRVSYKASKSLKKRVLGHEHA
jgi:hydrophobic/amphiphilic exporter-1 (mainly G- bacteria), HAE1 family